MAGNHLSGRKMKPISQHIAEGTFRRTRHGEKLAAIQAMATQQGQTELVIIDGFTDRQKEIALIVQKVLPCIPARMSFAFQTLVEDLAIYRQASQDVQEQGFYEDGSQGQRVLSAAFKARIEALNQLRKDFSTFAMSASEQADIMNIASKVNARKAQHDRMKKPSFLDCKPLE